MQLQDFHFDLPKRLIARFPVGSRSASRLLKVEDGELKHHVFKDLIDWVNEGDLLVFNDTSVIPARLFARKATGGKVECLVERILDDKRFEAQLRVSKPPKIGEQIFLENGEALVVLNKREQFYELGFQGEEPILGVIEALGQVPLPPYLGRLPNEADKERYQTVYAKHKGSIAAPTAGFHFDKMLLDALKKKGVQMAYLTLHIGAGTFAPIRSEDIKAHKMHSEYFEVTASLCTQIAETKAKGKRVIAVGTTSMRALQSASQSGVLKPFKGETAIFIYPGYEFKFVDALITNFHLPSSTLFMLVCAFGGHKEMQEAYETAVKDNYRFYSYGDAMWIESKRSLDGGCASIKV